MRQGIYREYQNFKHNDAKLKGTIDWKRHIAQNIPFAGMWHTPLVNIPMTMT